MSKIYVLHPMTVYMSQCKSTNEEDYHLVPVNRNDADPFYIIPELETDTRFYWSGFDADINCDAQFSCLKKYAYPVEGD